jgi:hypothetical protein
MRCDFYPFAAVQDVRYERPERFFYTEIKLLFRRGSCPHEPQPEMNQINISRCISVAFFTSFVFFLEPEKGVTYTRTSSTS